MYFLYIGSLLHVWAKTKGGNLTKFCLSPEAKLMIKWTLCLYTCVYGLIFCAYICIYTVIYISGNFRRVQFSWMVDLYHFADVRTHACYVLYNPTYFAGLIFAVRRSFAITVKN